MDLGTVLLGTQYSVLGIAMSLPAILLTTTCDIYRPFGAASPTTTGVPCRLAPAAADGSRAGSLNWTHTLDLQPGVDVRDGYTRPSGGASLSYADGDEVRVPSGGSPLQYL